MSPPRVLVTRAADDAPALSDALRAIGAEPVEVPLIERHYLPGAVAATGEGFDLLLVTSPATVPAIVDALQRGWRPPPRVAAVGPASAAAAEAAGLTVDLVPDTHTGRALADALDDVDRRRILYPRADRPTPGTSERLRERGADVVEVPVYRNVAPDGIAERLRAALPVDVITLLSGSAARRLVEVLGSAPDAHLVAIGPSTAEAARRAGLVVDRVAEPHTVEGVVEAVRTLLTPG